MGDIHAFVEMHIEQGNNLYSKSLDIGIVEGIVGLKWWDVKIEGFSNHARNHTNESKTRCNDCSCKIYFNSK